MGANPEYRDSRLVAPAVRARTFTHMSRSRSMSASCARHKAWLATGSTWSSGRMASISSTIRSTLARHSAAA